ncbi:MAG TPA: hypothetical protein VFW65_34750 [Pseudonocardiaceae bacterium]|nr:hypothetical protein [Pseudonocardiaceae bacterium]
MTALLHSIEHTFGREVGKVLWGCAVALVAGWQVHRRLRNRKK